MNQKERNELQQFLSAVAQLSDTSEYRSNSLTVYATITRKASKRFPFTCSATISESLASRKNEQR